MQKLILWSRSFFMAIGMCVTLFLGVSAAVTLVLTYGMRASKSTYHYRMEIMDNCYLACLLLTWVFVHILPRTTKIGRNPYEALKAVMIATPAVVGYLAIDMFSSSRPFQLGVVVSLTLICYAEELRRKMAVVPTN